MRISYILLGLLVSANCSVTAIEPSASQRKAISGASMPAELPLAVIVEAMSGCRVVPWEGQSGEALIEAAEVVESGTQGTPIVSGRVNEAGLVIEGRLEQALAQAGFTVDTPRTQSGRRQSAGYPDLVARRDGQTFYLEVKCFSAKTRNSTQRSFYLSATDDPKVTEDAIHLLFGFELEALPQDQYRVSRYELVDLSSLTCEVKIEYNASNRDLYGGGLKSVKAE